MGAACLGFNGAATFRSRKVARDQRQPKGLNRFNGAATFRSRKDCRAHASRVGIHGFNGAATFRSRKVPIDGCGMARRIALQWGRDLSVAEGGAGLAAGPAPSCFNGAATFRSRKVRGRQGLGLGRRAASMGPRPFGRGRRQALEDPLAGIRASMGPRPFGRGRLPADTAYLRWNGLQWGRDLSVAEGTRMTENIGEYAQLQWGRDLSVAEGCAWARARMVGVCRFNGAATFRSRKADAARAPFRLCVRASMGPRPFGRGRMEPARLAAPRQGFNGAATFRSRKGGEAPPAARAERIASMGPRPFGRGRMDPMRVP